MTPGKPIAGLYPAPTPNHVGGIRDKQKRLQVLFTLYGRADLAKDVSTYSRSEMRIKYNQCLRVIEQLIERNRTP